MPDYRIRRNRMMKKQWIAILLAGLLVMNLSACGKKDPCGSSSGGS